MPIAFACPGCGKQFRVSDNMAGRKAKCSACATIMQVPAGEVRVAAQPAIKQRVAPDIEDETDADETPLPRRKGRKKKKKGSMGLILALLGVGGAVAGMCLCGGVFAGLGWFGVWDPLGLFGGPPS